MAEDITPWEVGSGITAGQIQPSSITPPAGDFVVCLGSDIANAYRVFAPGDYVEVHQTAYWGGVNPVLRCTVSCRSPSVLPAGFLWRFSILVDDSEVVSRDITNDSALLTKFDLAANLVSKHGADAKVAFRLTMIGTGDERLVELPGVFIDTLTFDGPILWTAAVAADTVTDLSASMNDGTNSGVVDDDFLSDSPGGFAEYSIDFAGSSLINFGDDSSLDFEPASDPMSVGVWVKTTEAGLEFVITRSTASDNGWQVWINTGNPYIRIGNGGGSPNYIEVRTTSVTVNDGQWHHILWTKAAGLAASTVTCYVDGVLTATTIEDDLLGAGSALQTVDCQLGARAGSFQTTMQIAEPCVWATALGATEAGLVGNCARNNLQLDSGASIVGYWRPGHKVAA